MTARVFTWDEGWGHTIVTDSKTVVSFGISSGSRTPRRSEDDTADEHKQPTNRLVGWVQASGMPAHHLGRRACSQAFGR